MQSLDIGAFLTTLAVHLGVDYTDEQKEFAKSFDRTILCFASPGTGKTMSAVAGLLTAELYYRYPGENIYALSFTRMATGELAARHLRACRKLGIRQTVNFQTLHSICATILKQNAIKLGMRKLEVTDNIPMSTQVDIIMSSCDEMGISVVQTQIPKIVKAINKLNSSLIFDQLNVENSMDFKQANIDYDNFTKIRGLMFTYCLLTEHVQVSDIMLYTLLLLTKYPEVAQAFSDHCKLMLVDEAQDLSLLQLRIISLLAPHAILIGDIKQQIYAFNGACQEIVPQFYKLYPDATTLRLTQSFRCQDEIAKYATEVIIPNAISEDELHTMAFKGVSEGGTVNITDRLDLSAVIDETASKYMDNRNNFVKDILFLFRNNASAIPVAEKLFKANLPFRVNKYMKAFDSPVIKDLTNLALLAAEPDIPKNVDVLKLVISEMSQYRDVHNSPLYKIMSKTNCTVFDINYQYKNKMEAGEVFDCLLETRTLIQHGAMLTEVFNCLYPMYNKHWLERHEYLLEYKKEYYLGLVNDLIKTKTLDKFIQDELEKEQKINNYNDMQIGIRCYTMHAAKGLEADVVYILDANDGIVPNNGKLKRMIDSDCAVEAAREIRNERSLCYVAATRAKETLVIQYKDKLSPMFRGYINDYTELDTVYKCSKHNETDIEAFEAFAREFVYDKC